VGIRIIVVNYNIYQDLENYKGRDKGRPSVQLGHDNNKEEKGNNIYAQKFLTFYQAYPRHVAKKEAYGAWQTLEKTEDMEALLPVLLEAIEKHKQLPDWQKKDGKYIPYPSTWLNSHRWDDEV